MQFIEGKTENSKVKVKDVLGVRVKKQVCCVEKCVSVKGLRTSGNRIHEYGDHALIYNKGTRQEYPLLTLVIKF